MPKEKKKSVLQPRRCMYIAFEGAMDHSEHAYIKGFMQKNNYELPSIKIKCVDIDKNNPRGLVDEILLYKELDEDILWAAFDCDEHPLDEAMIKARDNGINIAFSNISFEIWILLHLKYSSRNFKSSSEVIKYMKSEPDIAFAYDKGNSNIYRDLHQKEENAEKIASRNAVVLRKNMSKSTPHELKTYMVNPYTNFDQLLEAIKNYVAEETSGKKINVKYDLPW